MTEKQFEELLRTLATLTEKKTITWQGSEEGGFLLKFGAESIILQRISNTGIILSIYNSEGIRVAAVTSANIGFGPKVHFFKSSIPDYIYDLIIRQSLRTDETLDSILKGLKQLEQNPPPSLGA